VRETLQDVDEEIAELGDGSVILCTDDYTIYDDIDEYDGIDAHLAITHDDTYCVTTTATSPKMVSTRTRQSVSGRCYSRGWRNSAACPSRAWSRPLAPTGLSGH